eukprot:SAG22_NODE_1065_length_5752_cov_12.512294_2_plen_412_part_00
MGKGRDAGKAAAAAYPPLAEVRKTLKVKWYRCPLEKGVLGQLSRRSDAQGLWKAGGHLALWLATGSAVYRCWHGQFYLCALLAMFLHGTVGSCFGYAVHELGHGTVFATKWLNRVFLVAFSLPLWWDPHDYASSHTYHHRFSQYPEADRENIFPLEPSLSPRLLLELFTINLTGVPGAVIGKGGLVSTVKLTVKAALGGIASEPGAGSHEWLAMLHADQPEEAARSMWFNRYILLFHAAVLGAAVASGEWLLVPLLSLHCFVGNAYSYFVGSTQHCGLRGSVPDFRKSTRSITLYDPLSEFLFWHMNWHIEHHMFASVPCYRLKALHDATKQHMPEPRTLVGAWREMRATWLRQQREPGYEFDTPLPDGGKAAAVSEAAAAAEEAASIGDLAAGLAGFGKDGRGEDDKKGQ